MAVLLLSGLVACGGGSGGGGDSVPLDDLASQATAAACARLTRCHFVSDTALCMAVYGPGIYQRQLFGDFGAAVATAKAGKAQYDGAMARACLDATQNGACADTVTPAVCDQVFTGTIAVGDRCINNVGCVPGTFCASPISYAAPCDGVCTAGGTMCNRNVDCSGGMVCDTMMGTPMSSGTCVTPVAAGAEGAACGTNNSCASGLFCSSGGVCTAPAQAGDPCVGVRNGFACAEGLVCLASADGTSMSCAAVVAKGEACTSSAQCGGSLTSLGCDPTSHLCVDLPSSGPCLGTGIFSCNALTSFCDTTMATPTCQPFAASGASCSTSNLGQCGTVLVSPGPICMSSGAATGTCMPPPGPTTCTP